MKAVPAPREYCRTTIARKGQRFVDGEKSPRNAIVDEDSVISMGLEPDNPDKNFTCLEVCRQGNVREGKTSPSASTVVGRESWTDKETVNIYCKSDHPVGQWTVIYYNKVGNATQPSSR